MMSDQETREALFELWMRFGTCIESDSSEGWEMVDAILSRFNVTPKDELKGIDSEHDRLVAERAWEEGARWAAVEFGIDASVDESRVVLVPSDNPYRKEQDAADA